MHDRSIRVHRPIHVLVGVSLCRFIFVGIRNHIGMWSLIVLRQRRCFRVMGIDAIHGVLVSIVMFICQSDGIGIFIGVCLVGYRNTRSIAGCISGLARRHAVVCTAGDQPDNDQREDQQNRTRCKFRSHQFFSSP